MKITMDLVKAQRLWIEDHGGCEDGYVRRYGNPNLNYCYGNGGTSIWKDDNNHLNFLIKKVGKTS